MSTASCNEHIAANSSAKRGCRGALPTAEATELGYFEKEQARVRFIGLGVVEAGCKTVVGQRAQQSWMCWTEAGLLAVLHARCALFGGQFDAFWDHLNDAALPTRALAA